LQAFYAGIKQTLETHKNLLASSISDSQRKTVLDGLGNAGSKFREQIYSNHFSGKKATIGKEDLLSFISTALDYLDHSIEANRRKDNMYHAYNLMTVKNEREVKIDYLDEMLEGQVAVLSSGFLSAEESLEVLDGLKNSALFRADQYSYILYPNKNLPKFLAKNVIPKEKIGTSKLLSKMIEKGDTSIVEQDVKGHFHFNGSFKNADNLKVALENLSNEDYHEDSKHEEAHILEIFESVFNHKAFTGRSGTFYGYEGLGSIYWHMVSKLLLAVEECCLKAVKEKSSPDVIGKLMEHFYEINEGIGVHKSPKLYGAFSIDPYSHTPGNKGVQQPGMTGQVKEDILSRIGELGALVHKGQLSFQPSLLRASEFIDAAAEFRYVNLDQKACDIALPANTIAFTYCQVPIIYTVASVAAIEVTFSSGKTETIQSNNLPTHISEMIFGRTGEVTSVRVSILENSLK
jgi:hypothetical protein